MDDRITSDVPVSPGTPVHRSRRMRAVGLVVALLAAFLTAVGPAAAETVVMVGAGDSLSEIAVENGVSLVDLMVANNITNADLVFMGQRLVIPGTGSSSGPSPATLPVAIPKLSGDLPLDFDSFIIPFAPTRAPACH